MITKTITCTNFDGVETTEKYYFNFTESELVAMESERQGGYSEMLKRISDAKDMPELMKEFRHIIIASYGEKSADGKYFIKTKNGESLGEMFAQTSAFDTLFMELISDLNKFADFINGLVPAKYRSELAEQTKAAIETAKTEQAVGTSISTEIK